MQHSTDFNVLIKSLESISHAIQNKREEIGRTKLVGKYKNDLISLINDLLTALNNDLNTYLIPFFSSIYQKTNKKEKLLMIMEGTKHNLEEILDLVEYIINNNCKNIAIHEFVSYTMRDLNLEVPYAICTHRELATENLIESFKKRLDIFLVWKKY